MYQTLLTHLEAGILTVTINRPEKLNALNQQVLSELNRVLDEIDRDTAIRSVILTGAGPKAFVAGADITEFTGRTQQEGMDMARFGQSVFFRIERNTKPIVAAVNGFALGGGCELALSCHFRFASEAAKFGQPEVNLGLIPGFGGTQRLAQLIGKGKALELLLSAQMLDAHQARQWGLVNEVFPPEELLPQTRKVLEVINSKAPLAIAGCIRAVNALQEGNAKGYETEVQEFGHCFSTQDKEEGVQAFLEKRKAQFKGN
ncbi:MAG: enoyl-CoA hydratase/isomerase family protein [Chitinophagaceae bacterium]